MNKVYNKRISVLILLFTLLVAALTAFSFTGTAEAEDIEKPEAFRNVQVKSNLSEESISLYDFYNPEKVFCFYLPNPGKIVFSYGFTFYSCYNPFSDVVSTVKSGYVLSDGVRTEFTNTENKAFGFQIPEDKLTSQTEVYIEYEEVEGFFEFLVKDSSSDSSEKFKVLMHCSQKDYTIGLNGEHGVLLSGKLENVNNLLKDKFGKELVSDWTFAWAYHRGDERYEPVVYSYLFEYSLTDDILTLNVYANNDWCDVRKLLDRPLFDDSDDNYPHDMISAIEGALEDSQYILQSWHDVFWDLKYPDQIVAPITFKYSPFGNDWLEELRFFHVGEMPVPETDLDFYDYHKIAFVEWSPAIQPVASAEPVTYTAIYKNPTIQVSKNGCEPEEIELTYGYIDEELLYKNFTSEFKDIGSIESIPAELIEFTNRRDFWFTQRSDNIIVHSCDTNLTLEAVSFQFRKKGTDIYLSFENAKDMFGKNEVNWNWFTYMFSHGGSRNSENFFEAWLGTMSETLGFKTKDKEQLMEEFMYSHYPAAVKQAPDEYDLVYVYYYSVDLAESGDDGYFDYRDDYKKSVLKVKNNLTDTVAEYSFSYDLEKGCYFLLSMDSYWKSMNKVSSVNAEFLGNGVKAEISDAKFTIKGFDGTVLYDGDKSSNLRQALTSTIYLYTNKLSPDYEDEYTVTVEFYDITVYQEDKTDNIGSVIDDLTDKENWDKVWEIVKIVFWVVVGVLCLVLVIKLGKLIYSAVKKD